MAAGIDPATDFFDNMMDVMTDPNDPTLAGAHLMPVHVHHDPGVDNDWEQFHGNFNDDSVGIDAVRLHNAYACVVVMYCLLLMAIAVTSVSRGADAAAAAAFVAPCSNSRCASTKIINNALRMRDILDVVQSSV